MFRASAVARRRKLGGQRERWHCALARGWLHATLAVLLLALGLPVRAWSGHTLGTWQALAAMPELAGKTVKAVPLERFVVEQALALERLLAEHEAWARASLPDYPARPDHLAFRAAPAAAGGSGAPPRDRLLLALRLNPFVRLPLFVQLRPGEAGDAADLLPWNAVTTLASGIAARENRYRRVAEGELLPVLDVVATASNEPDYGIDLGLFADNGTTHGGQFGFGKQPFGNAKLDYSSQAPFHMGFHHESRIVYAAAGFLRRTQPEARVALFSALARHAFASGHDYWGWRLTGWALHYVQDLTQPYHSMVLPGVGTVRMLGINLLAMLGYERPKIDAITLVSNRHSIVETYQFKRMVRAYSEGRLDDALLAALRDTSQDKTHWRYEPASTRALVSLEAHASADALDAQLVRSFPAKYTDDPAFTLGMQADMIAMEAVARQHSASEHEQLEQQVVTLLQRFGRHSRALVRALASMP